MKILLIAVTLLLVTGCTTFAGEMLQKSAERHRDRGRDAPIALNGETEIEGAE